MIEQIERNMLDMEASRDKRTGVANILHSDIVELRAGTEQNKTEIKEIKRAVELKPSNEHQQAHDEIQSIKVKLENVEHKTRRNENNIDYALKLCDRLSEQLHKPRNNTTSNGPPTLRTAGEISAQLDPGKLIITEDQMHKIKDLIVQSMEPKIAKCENEIMKLYESMEHQVDDKLLEMEQIGTSQKISDIENMTAAMLSENTANMILLETRLSEVTSKCQDQSSQLQQKLRTSSDESQMLNKETIPLSPPPGVGKASADADPECVPDPKELFAKEMKHAKTVAGD